MNHPIRAIFQKKILLTAIWISMVCFQQYTGVAYYNDAVTDPHPNPDAGLVNGRC